LHNIDCEHRDACFSVLALQCDTYVLVLTDER